MKLKWTIEFSIDEGIVKDGFNFTNERAQNMIENHLIFAYGDEVKARVISKPNKFLIRKIQRG